MKIFVHVCIVYANISDKYTRLVGEILEQIVCIVNVDEQIKIIEK